MQVAEYLRRMPLFSALTEEEMLDVLRIAKVVRFASGAELCRAGAAGTCMYLIDKGTVSVHVNAPGRVSVEVKTLGPGDVFGELSLVDQQPRSADVIAVDDVVAYAIDREEFDKLRAQMNPAVFKMLRHIALIISTRLRELNDFATGGIESIPQREPRDQVKQGTATAGWLKWFSSLRKATP
ncbi:MAG: cyclic nucleotide-binding domain-containing protein [Myxococcales bacterium]|nr:cyclic nucleotide-binding domain-containing protein [Myxococcales bacterium]